MLIVLRVSCLFPQRQLSTILWYGSSSLSGSWAEKLRESHHATATVSPTWHGGVAPAVSFWQTCRLLSSLVCLYVDIVQLFWAFAQSFSMKHMFHAAAPTIGRKRADFHRMNGTVYV